MEKYVYVFMQQISVIFDTLHRHL